MGRLRRGIATRRVVGIVRPALAGLGMLLIAAHAPLRAQTPGPIAGSAALVSAEDIARQLAVLLSDSMRPRATPSPALERAARYVADEMQRLGLQPGVMTGTPSGWVQRYPVPDQQRLAGVALTFIQHSRQRRDSAVGAERGSPFMPVPAQATYLTPEVGPQTLSPPPLTKKGLAPMPLVLVAGRQTAATVRQAAATLRSAVALYLPALGVDSATRRQVAAELYATSAGVLLVDRSDSASFASAQAAAGQRSPAFVGACVRQALGPRRWPWAITVWGNALRRFFGSAGIEPVALDSASGPVFRAFPFPSLSVNVVPVAAAAATAPNVVGLLPGRDTALHQQVIVVAAHLDDVAGDTGTGAGTRVKGAAAEERTADGPSALGVAALLAVARALNQPDMQPRRPVLFLVASGEEQTYAGVQTAWGANYLVDSLPLPLVGWSTGPVLSASLTLSALDAGAADSILLDGLDDLDLPLEVLGLLADRAELGLAVAAGQTVLRPGGGSFAFVRRAAPTLALRRAGTNPAGATAARADAATAEQVARVARVAAHLVRSVADADRLPTWKADARARLQEFLTP